ILSARQIHGSVTVAEVEGRDFRTRQTLLDDETTTGIAEGAVEHGGPDSRLGIGPGFGNDDPFSGGQTVGLDDHGPVKRLTGHLGKSGVYILADSKSGGRNAMSRHEVLGVDFGTFEGRTGARRAKNRQ